jgi:hypothetical protein
MPQPVSVRRGFLQGLLGLGGAAAAFAAPAPVGVQKVRRS